MERRIKNDDDQKEELEKHLISHIKFICADLFSLVFCFVLHVNKYKLLIYFEFLLFFIQKPMIDWLC